MAFHLRFEFNVPQNEIDILVRSLPLYFAVRVISFIIGKTYAGIIKYTGAEDALRMFKTLVIGTLIMLAANFIRAKFFDGQYFFPISILVIDLMLCFIGLMAYRIATKMLYQQAINPSSGKRKVVVYGAGEAGVITKRTLDRDANTKLQVVAFIDDDKKKSGKRLEGVPIYHSSKLEQLLSDKGAEQVILAIQKPSSENRQAIIDTALSHSVPVLSVPPVNDWIKGKLSYKQLKPIKIEDLLERKEIELDKAMIRSMIEGKKVMVTGAAGSIGSGIVKQLIPFGPKQIVLFEQAESPLYELQLELEEISKSTEIICAIGDVRNPDRMANVFKTFEPEIVYHAAAYKHVPLMENNPSEAILTNILGSKIAADLASKYGVKTFVLISTDKAVNPTSVMGASKRIAEMYCQSLNKKSDTSFITTRFGNVLGSNGSVIPIFKKQIEKGGPVTITHENINRFFMTIAEACQLVIEAGAMGKGGEIFIFDMGESVRIKDLALNMIRLSGLEPGKDIEVKITGLRPGEKIFEELLTKEEGTLPTHHEKIMVAKVRENDHAEVNENVTELIGLFTGQNNTEIVTKMKDIVPEYISHNSMFEQLDLS
ncbi:MAG: polysaccharide biosynthesis protein [Flavobacteriales bacterium]|nr:polysaccharide biosynthesis protein [Flavobacteriales bacterium]